MAWPSLIARVFSAVVLTILCFRKRNGVHYKEEWIAKWNAGLLRRILRIAVPNGVEQGIFQFVKVALSSIVALFGTCQIAANGPEYLVPCGFGMCDDGACIYHGNRTVHGSRGCGAGGTLFP